jgi:hypothetical protein
VYSILNTTYANVRKGVPMDPENNRRAMAYFATIGVAEQDMKPPNEVGKSEPGEQVEHGAR